MKIKELYNKISNELVIDYTSGFKKVNIFDGNTKFSVGNGVPSLIYLTKDIDNYVILTAENKKSNIDLNSFYNYLTDTKNIWGKKKDIEILVRKEETLRVEVKGIKIEEDEFLIEI